MSASKILRYNLSSIALLKVFRAPVQVRDPEQECRDLDPLELSYTPLLVRRIIERGGQTYSSKLHTAAEGPIPDGNALYELKKSCKGRVELLTCLTLYNESFEMFLLSLGGCLRNYAELLEENEA